MAVDAKAVSSLCVCVYASINRSQHFNIWFQSKFKCAAAVALLTLSARSFQLMRPDASLSVMNLWKRRSLVCTNQLMDAQVFFTQVLLQQIRRVKTNTVQLIASMIAAYLPYGQLVHICIRQTSAIMLLKIAVYISGYTPCGQAAPLEPQICADTLLRFECVTYLGIWNAWLMIADRWS